MVNIAILHIEDNDKTFNSEIKSLKKVLDNYRNYKGKENPASKYEYKKDVIKLSNCTLHFKEKKVNLGPKPTNDTIEYNLCEIQNEINELKKDLGMDRVILVIDICLDSEENKPFPESFAKGISELNCVSGCIFKTAGVVAAQLFKGKGLTANGFFSSRSVSPNTNEFVWSTTDSSQYEFENRIDEIGNESIREIVKDFSGTDSINLRYFATIFLVAGLAIGNQED